MNKKEKVEQIEQIKELFTQASAVYLVDYHGVNVADISQLRRDFRKEGATYKVFKNTLIKRALKDVSSYDKFNDDLVGMSGVVFCGENYVAPAKVIKKYFDTTNKFSLKGCYIGQEYFDSNKLDVLASMLTKEEVMAGIVGSLNSPISGIVGAINAVMRDLVSVIDEVSKKKAA